MSDAASFSMRTSFSAVEGLPETEKNAGESENTYILRPIFQQRRVADALWRGRPARLQLPAGTACLIAGASGRNPRVTGGVGRGGTGERGRG